MFTLIVPKNEEGKQKCDIGIDDIENQLFFDLSVEEYEVLRENKVFEILNNKYGLWIDEGETESISANQLKETRNVIIPMRGAWSKAVDAAIGFKTCLITVF